MTKWVVRFVMETEDDVKQAEVRDYVSSAVRRMGGSHPPDDPFFGDNKTVGAVSATKIKPPAKRKRKPTLVY